MNDCSKSCTRKISPLIGVFGILGLLGPILYSVTQQIFMIALIGFIVLFSFYYEGKMSGTLKDERFIYNESKANSKSYKFAAITTIFCLIISFNIPDNRVAYIFLVSLFSTVMGISIILSKYLLYKYDLEDKDE